MGRDARLPQGEMDYQEYKFLDVEGNISTNGERTQYRIYAARLHPNKSFFVVWVCVHRKDMNAWIPVVSHVKSMDLCTIVEDCLRTKVNENYAVVHNLCTIGDDTESVILFVHVKDHDSFVRVDIPALKILTVEQ